MSLAPSFRAAAQTWGARALARDSTEMDSVVSYTDVLCYDVRWRWCVTFTANNIIKTL